MVTNLYEPLLEATRSVFQLMLDLSDITAYPPGTFECDEEVDISIGVTGDLTGEMLYRFPHATSLNMVRIMTGMEIDTIDDFVTSAISEIANIISGNILTILAENDLTCDLLPPMPRTSEDGKKYDSRTACCISTPAGDVCLDIRLNSGK